MTTFAYRPSADADWIEIAAPVVLPAFGVQPGPEGDDVPADVQVSPAFVASLSVEARAAAGLVAVVETARPVGVEILGSTIEDDDGVPTRAWQTEAFAGEVIAAQRAALAAAILDEAGRRLTALVPVGMQLYLLSLGFHTVVAHGLDPAGWPAEVQAAYAASLPNWAAAQALVAAMSAITAAVPADPVELAAFDVAGHPLWP